MDIREARVLAEKIHSLCPGVIPDELKKTAVEHIAYDLKDYSLEEAIRTLDRTVIYLPHYKSEFRRLMIDIKKVADYNRLPAEEIQKDRQDALERWYRACARLNSIQK